jgi:hypothetical protein
MRSCLAAVPWGLEDLSALKSPRFFIHLELEIAP